MKLSKVSLWVGASVIAASIAIIPLNLAAIAQDNAPGTNTQRNAEVDNRGPIPDHTNRDQRNDLNWFGLLGLVGLAGLAGRNRHETTSTDYVSR